MIVNVYLDKPLIFHALFVLRIVLISAENANVSNNTLFMLKILISVFVMLIIS